MPIAEDSTLLTHEQVIELLLEDANLRRVAVTCVLPAIRCSDGWRYRKSDLDAWIAQQYAARAARKSIRRPS